MPCSTFGNLTKVLQKSKYYQHLLIFDFSGKITIYVMEKSRSLYKASPNRKAPARKGMVWEEEDWVHEEAVGLLRDGC